MNEEIEVSTVTKIKQKIWAKSNIKLVAMLGLLIGCGVYFQYEMTDGMYSRQSQIDFVMDIYDMEFECEIIDGVPNNYYSGEIDAVNSPRTLAMTSPFMFNMKLTSEDIEMIQAYQLEKFSNLPCFDQWLENQDVD